MSKSNDGVAQGLTRRHALMGVAPVLAAGFLLGGRAFAAAGGKAGDPVAALEALEAREGGRLGVMIIDTGSGTMRGHRQDEHFALCSTFKFVLAAAILQRHDAGSVSLDRALQIAKADIIPNSPVTKGHVGRTLTVGDLCHATVTTSDNAAANILLRELGGTEPVTAFLRGLGDQVTRLDRMEPHMNNADVAAGDMRDTTTPSAMASTLGTIMLGDVLTPGSREILTGWMKATMTGPDRLRRGLPADWILGHKTGTGNDGPTNDIGIAWPPNRAPVIVTVYYDRTGRTMKENATILAEVGRIAGGIV